MYRKDLNFFCHGFGWTFYSIWRYDVGFAPLELIFWFVKIKIILVSVLIFERCAGNNFVSNLKLF